MQPSTEAQEAAGGDWLTVAHRGQTLQQIADLLNAEGHRTAQGTEYQPTTVWRMVNREDPQANPEGGYRGNLVAAPAGA